MSQGYGADTWCIDQLRPGVFARGPAVVAQAAYRRLITPRGTLQGDDEASAYGFDVAGYVGSVGTATAIQALPSQAVAEIKKDDRIADATCTIVQSTDTDGSISLILTVEAALSDGSGTFTLTLAVNAVGVSLLGIAS